MRYYAIWLSLICIFMFILQVSIPGFTDIFVLNQQSFSQPYRIITAIFLHGSLQHLIYNLFALLLFGLILERLIKDKFLYVFFISGILANIISPFFYDSALGASGAIFGIIGCLTILKPGMGVFAFGMILPLWVASIFWVIGDIMGIFIPSGIANLAHLVGVVVGFIFGIILRRKIRVKEKIRINLPERQIRIWEDNFMR